MLYLPENSDTYNQQPLDSVANRAKTELMTF